MRKILRYEYRIQVYMPVTKDYSKRTYTYNDECACLKNQMYRCLYEYI